jgi:hypothetical protein
LCVLISLTCSHARIVPAAPPPRAERRFQVLQEEEQIAWVLQLFENRPQPTRSAIRQ